MTWQNVIGAKTNKEAKFKVADDAATPEELGMEPVESQPANVRVHGLFLELEPKSGDAYEFSVTNDATVDFEQMAEDIVGAIDDGKDVWVDVDFNANADRGRVLYWSDGAPWEGGDVKDNYGISEGF